MSTVKIEKAFCYESGAIETADVAIAKRAARMAEPGADKSSDHYFCAAPDCFYPVTAAHWHETGVAWYRSLPDPPDKENIPACTLHPINGVKSHAKDRETRQSRAERSQRVLIPNWLGKGPSQLSSRPTRIWREHQPPTLREIADLKAVSKPIVIPGELEAVVDAWGSLKGDRSSYPIKINGFDTDYRQGFPWIWDLAQNPWEPLEWAKGITRAYCKVSSGTQKDGIWFLNVTPPREGKHAFSKTKISLTLRQRELQGVEATRGYIALLTEAARAKETIHLFWRGLQPQPSGTRWNLTSAKDILPQVALRPVAKKKTAPDNSPR